MDRKKLSKRLRFDVFKRDSFACQYCGRTPPAVVLEVDHVLPIAEGGSDDAENLLTACLDCNRGKSCTPLTVVPAAHAEQRAIAQESEDQIREFRTFLRRRNRRINRDIEQVAGCFAELFPERSLTERFKRVSVKTFLEHFLADELCDFLDMAYSRIVKDSRRKADPDAVVRYFCGICWRRIKERDDREDG